VKGANRALLFLVAAGMELCYLYACANFVTFSVFHRTFPFWEAVGSFVLAALLTLLTQGRGWRVVWVLGVQAIGFVATGLAMIRFFHSWSDAFLNQTWFVQSFDNPVGVLEWFTGLLMVGWALVFWGGGVRLVRRPTDYFTLCSRFDRGLLAFFVLLLVKFLLRVRGEMSIDESTSELMIFPFLIFSLLAIGLARNRTDVPRDFLPGYRGVGVILSFGVVILMVSTGLVLFCLPYMTQAAEAGYGALKIVSRPVGFILLKILLFLFGRSTPLAERQPTKKEVIRPDLGSQGETSWWLELLGKILAYGLWIILGLVILGLISIIVFFFIQWLFSRTEKSRESQSPWPLIASWLEGLRRFLQVCWRGFVSRIRGYRGVVQIYAGLLKWGHRSGLPHGVSETPAEYGSRLKDRFPAVKQDVELIVGAFNEHVYGEINLNERQFAMTQSAWRRLRSPLLWPTRARAWFRRPLDPQV